MDWSNLISGITSAGFTQQDIATYCDCGQSTISDLFRGEIKQPAYRIGERLMNMHANLTELAEKKAA